MTTKDIVLILVAVGVGFIFGIWYEQYTDKKKADEFFEKYYHEHGTRRSSLTPINHD